MADKSRDSALELYALLDERWIDAAHAPDAALAAATSGAAWIQLRYKSLPDEALLRLADAVGKRLEGQAVRLILNDRADIALISIGYGVHLGEDDVPIAVARAALGAAPLIGATCRSAYAIAAAARAGASYAGVGPVFDSHTKALSVQRLGIEGLRTLAADAPLPLVAIGGIDVRNIASVAATGVRAAAVAQALGTTPAQVADAVTQLRRLAR